MIVYRLVILIFIILATSDFAGAYCYIPESRRTSLNDSVVITDTLKENQILYNGRVWKNIYHNVEGDQFLFTKSFLPGSVSVRGNSFPEISIMYDIFNDEILIPFSRGGIIQLNKQMVDSFSVNYQNRKYRFTVLQIDSMNNYVHIIYEGKSALYVRYAKKIEKLADQGKYDKFYEANQIIYVKNNVQYPIEGKRDLLNASGEDSDALKDFINENKIKISVKDPNSFVPAIRFLDSINHRDAL